MLPLPSSPDITVIVPAYNAERTIELTMASVLEQADVRLECVVVDDESTDGTADLVARLATADSRVVFLRQEENAGVSAARNRALDRARGDWITFVDADDRLRPGALAALHRAATGQAARLVVGQRISTDGERWWYPVLYDKRDIREPGRKSLAAHPDLLYYLGPPGKLFHRSLAEGLRFEGRMLGDQPWVLRALIRAGDDIVVVDDLVYEWWRPRPTEATDTITTARTHSAKLGVEAVRMAGVAFRAAAETFVSAYDATTQVRLEALYFERLLRSDLGAQYRHAVRTADPDLPAMHGALTDLIGSVPATVIGSGAAIAKELVEPTLNYWDRLDETAVGTFWNMVEAAWRAQPRLLDTISRRRWRLILGACMRIPVPCRSLSAPLLRRDALRRAARRAKHEAWAH
jgi:glycosyltransferase involved in cell wall biosynthesis